MATAENGNKVKVKYTGKLESGKVFGSSEEGKPIEFQIGEGQIIPGFEEAVVGMSEGESKTVEVPSEKAYGPHRDDRVFEVERASIPDDVSVEVGGQLEVRHQNGESTIVTVAEAGPEKVKLDANHPLAGKDLTFDIELLEVEQPA